MALLYVDIETVPTNDKAIINRLRESISPPGNITKDETKAKWMETNADEEADKLIRKTALDGLYGQIISIAWAYDDSETHALYRSSYDDSEELLLWGFFDAIYSAKDDYGNRMGITKWIGHYITGFDLRFIWQRCVINKVTPLVKIPYDAKPWDAAVFDTKVAWSGASQYSGASSLSKLSEVMLGEGKGEIDGSNVFDFWKAGEIKKIVDYNKMDVEMCRNLYKRMNFVSEIS